MKNKKIKKPSKKLLKSSKIVIGTTTVLATATAVVVPIVVSNNKVGDNNKKVNEASFSSLDKTNLPSAVTKNQIKALEGLTTLEDEDIALTPIDDNGTLQVTITNHGPEKVINLSGFETTESQALKTKVQSLKLANFSSLDKTNLPSAVTKTQIKALEGLNTLEDEDIALTPNNDNGTLQVIITNHGPEKNINLSGFETTESQALKTKVQSLKVANFSSLDKTNLPSAVTKTQIKALEGLNTLEDEDIALTPNNDNGTLQVIITNHGPEKVINLSDFPKKVDLEAIEKISKTLEKTQYITEDDSGTDNFRNFANDLTDLQNQAKTKNIYLELLELIKKYKIPLNSLTPLPEGYTYKITNKMQGDQSIKAGFYDKYTIYNYELKFEILKNGFVYKEFTTTIEIALLTLDIQVQNLNEDSFDFLDKTNLPSAVTKTQIKNLAKIMIKFPDGVMKIFATLEDENIALTPNNDNGTLQVTITNHGPEKNINLSGFETTESQALKTKVQSLKVANFSSLDKTNLPSAVTKTQIKALEGLNTLEDEDIALTPNNDNGTLQVIITNHGPEKNINLSGFETTAGQALKTKVQSLKVANFSSLDKTNLPSAVTKTQIKALEGLTTLEDEDIALTPNNDNGTLQVTITNHGPEKVINLSDFPKKVDLEAIEKISKTLEKTQYITEDDSGTDNFRNFANDLTDLQNQAKTKNIYLELLELIKKYKIPLNSLTPLPEGYTYKITNKMQGDQSIKAGFYDKYTIYNYELKFEILKNGFVYKEFTTTIEIALLTLDIQVQNLNEDSFDFLDKTNLPSAVTKTQIKNLAKIMIKFPDGVMKIFATLEDENIALTPNNDNGTLQVTITNYGPEKNINLSGFETTSGQALQALKTKVQSLKVANFASLDKTNLPSAVTKTQIKALEGLTTLEDEDIALTPSDDNGTLQVTITNHGPEKNINLSGFETTA